MYLCIRAIGLFSVYDLVYWQWSVMYLFIVAIGLFSVYDIVYCTVIGHVFVCWGYRPFLCLQSCLMDSVRSCICVLGLSILSLSTILSIWQWLVMYLCVGAIGLFVSTILSIGQWSVMYLFVRGIGLFSVYDLVCWTLIGHVFVCWGYRSFLCLGSCLLDSEQSCICVLGLKAFSLSRILFIGQWSVMYLFIGAIDLFSVYNLV